jgi:hypothetical protein
MCPVYDIPLQTVTIGRELAAARTKEYDNGLEGLCLSINGEGNTVAIGCRNSHVLLLDLKVSMT